MSIPAIRPYFLHLLFLPAAFFYFYSAPKPTAAAEAISCTAPPSQTVFDSSLEKVTINDNRHPAGALRNGVYYINLEIGEGYWWPEQDKGKPLKIKAFAEAGKPLQVPGPLIRVPAGATVQISIRNDIKGPVKIFGFTSRLYRPDNHKDSLVIQEGETSTIKFNAGTPGTFLYTAKDKGDTLTPASVATAFFNSQLYGALIVDPSDEIAPTKERIFIIGVCGAGNSADAVQTKYVINGLSWPHTERLQYTVGEKVDWRIINASVLGHPMHLHGFPFVICSFVFPSAAKDSVIPEEKRKPVVTQNLTPLNRMRISWIPEKTGNWLFHCHLLDHTLPANFVAAKYDANHNHMSTETHASSGMGGLILGIQVMPGKKQKEEVLVTSTPERKLTLFVGKQPQNFSNNPNGKGFLLLEDGNRPANTYSIPGPTIVLKKDQGVAIKVINHLTEPTTIHWHGLSVDSYFDGVAGWGNQGKKLAPLIQPNDSFTVHLTPSQAGTFMYHTHMHNRQIFDGLYGAMVVLNHGENYDSTTDKVFLSARVAIILGTREAGSTASQICITYLTVTSSRRRCILKKALGIISGSSISALRITVIMCLRGRDLKCHLNKTARLCNGHLLVRMATCFRKQNTRHSKPAINGPLPAPRMILHLHLLRRVCTVLKPEWTSKQ